MIIIAQLAFALYCILAAKSDAKKIAAGEAINHRDNAINSLCVMVFLGFWFWHWTLLLLFPLIGRLVFDVALNRYRKLPWDYVSEWVKANDPRSSKIDRIEYKAFGDGSTPKLLYAALIILINLLHFFL